jgi:hypothetical protein
MDREISAATYSKAAQDAQAQLGRLQSSTADAQPGSSQYSAALQDAGYLMQTISENKQKAREAATKLH